MTEKDKIEEKKAKAFGMTLTIVVHSLILVFFLFFAAWTPPNPPPPDMGIEVDFGFDNQGSGEMNSKTQANNSESFDEQKPMPETPQPVEEARPTPSEPTPAETPSVVEAESEVSVKATPKKEEPVKKPEETPKKEPEKVNTATTLGGKGTSETPQASSHGNTTGTGNMGTETGTLNADALLGVSTGKGGSALSMPGWKWETPPAVSDNSKATGKLVFEIKIDENGEVISANRVYSDIVDRAVVNAYYEAVMDLLFEQTTNTDAPPMTTGRITFIITSK